MITTLPIQFTSVKMNILQESASWLSIASTSFVNMPMSRPRGVVSKTEVGA